MAGGPLQARDARTTPRWLQLPGLLLLGLVLVYEAVAVRYAMDQDVAGWPAWLKAHPFSLWPATWKMFTSEDRTHRDMYGRVLRDGTWERVELLPLFPARWESGPRYIRKPFWRETVNVNTMAQALCGRLPERPDAVELWLVDWQKTLGQVEQPLVEDEHRRLVRWDCDDHQPLPTGRRL